MPTVRVSSQSRGTPHEQALRPPSQSGGTPQEQALRPPSWLTADAPGARRTWPWLLLLVVVVVVALLLLAGYLSGYLFI
jgi:hypothetical protein